VRQYTTGAQDYELPGPSGQPGKKGVLLERTKTTRAGDYLECEIYPVVLLEQGMRQRLRHKSPEAIERANRERARRSLERLLNANFTAGDLLLHLTMARPCPLDEMQRLVRNYIKRLKYRAGKRGAPCKYVYVIETTGEGDRMRHHVHMVLSSGGGWITRDEAEGMWRHGLARADRCKRQEKGLAGFARYITQRKETQRRLMRRSWGASKNLKQPAVTIADKKFSRAAAARIAQGIETDARRILEAKYPGYRLVEQPVIRWSDFLPGCYIYAFLERIRQDEHKTGTNAGARARAVIL